jgi:hypothetical protein
LRKGIAKMPWKLSQANAELDEERGHDKNSRHRRKRFLCSSEQLRF